jgi:hypothetical protein
MTGARLSLALLVGLLAASVLAPSALAASPPGVSLNSFVPVGSGNAVLEGAINPNGSATEYHFDYAGQAAFEANGFNGAARVPATNASAGSGTAAVSVAQQISGLAQGTTYHYRLVASSVEGPSEATGTFATPTDAASCPNGALRSEQTSSTFPGGSAFFPRCMGLELISPAQKFNQYAIEGQIGVTDDRVQFTSIAALDSPRLGSILDKYLASRGGAGWTSHSMQMGSNYTNGNVATGLPCAYAPDLSNWTTYASTESQAKLGIANVLQQNVAGDVYPLGPVMTPFNNVGVFAVGNSSCFGGSADGSHYYFAVKQGAYGPDDPSPGVQGEDIYDVYRDAGVPKAELIQRDRDGKVYGGTCGVLLPGPEEGTPRRGSTSPDGSWLYFTTSPQQPEGSCDQSVNRKRVMRRDRTPLGPVISEVGASECTRIAPACDPTDGDDTFKGASQEGDKVFFTTTRQLANTDLDSGTACSVGAESTSAGCDLYLYDYSKPVGSRLTQVSAGDATDPTPGQGAEVLGVADIAGNGSRAYFVARGILTTNPNEFGQSASAAARNLYMYERDAAHPAGRTVFIGQLATTDARIWASERSGISAIAVPMLGADLRDHGIGGDGHVLALLSNAALSPGDTDGGYADLYRYDSDSGSLERVSRAAPGGSDNGPFDVSFQGPGAKTSARSYIGLFGAEPGLVFYSRRISEDGGTAAFVTGEKLSPSDGDEAENSYLWNDGDLVAIPTSGTPSVSASGDEVVFTTASQLLPQDGDGASDVYAARVDGGFPIPVPPVPCSGEACQGPPGGQPGAASATTETAPSTGNVQAKKKHHKKKHHKKHHRKHHKNKNHGKKQAGGKQGGK